MRLPRIGILLALLASGLSAPAAPDAPPASIAQVRLLLDQGKKAQARDMARELLGALESRGTGDTAGAADLLDLMLRASHGSPEGGEATRQLAARAVAVKEKVSGPSSPALADTLCSAGLALRWAGEYDAGRPLYDRCLAIREKALPADDPALAETLLEMANLIQRQGRFAEALPLYEQALALRERRLGPGHPDVASVLHNMGNLRLRMGDYVEARRFYQRALEIRRTALGPHHIDVALTLVTMGVLYQNMEDYGAAREVLEEAIPICREQQGPDSMLLSGALNNLGNVHWSVGKPELARDAYRQALDIKLRVFGPEHPDLIAELNNLAEAEISMGRNEEAVPLLQQGIRIVESRLGPDHFSLAPPINNLGSTMLRLGRPAEARPLYERSLAIRVAHVGRLHPDVAGSLISLAGLALAEGRRPEALRLAVEANDLLLAQIRDTLAYLPERSAVHLASQRQQPQAVLFEGLRTAGDDAGDWLAACWNWSLQRKGIVLEEMAARHRAALREDDPRAQEARDRLARARGELGALWVDGPAGDPADEYQVKLRGAIEQKEAAEEALAEVSLRFREEQARRRADMESIRRSLRPGEALVEFARVAVGMPAQNDKPVHDIALILTPDGKPSWEDLGAAAATDRLVAAWRAELSSSFAPREDTAAWPAAQARLEKAGADLRRAIWDPVARHLRGARLVLIVPDGSIHQIDFGALPAEAGKFLIEQAPPMQLLSAGRDLLARAGAGGGARAPRALLAVGAADFGVPATEAAPAGNRARQPGKGPACPSPRDTAWTALPESAREVTAIAELMKPRASVTILTGAQATETAVRSAAPGRAILHLATHGYFLETCADTEKSPLLRSGLVLAGANGGGPADPSAHGNDGILTAEEIVALDLRGVDLTVLSACDTGRGDVAVGEGVFGLRRALEIAGSKTVVMSLWPVPDRQARRWMTEFYRGRALNGVPAREAARNASLSLLEDLRARQRAVHPYMWSGFVVAGGVD